MGNVYWLVLVDGEREKTVDAVEGGGERTCGASRETVATSLRVGGLCAGRSL